MRMRTLTAACLLSLVALSGCGTTDAPKSGDEKDHAAGGPVSITDSRGKEIKLDHPAKKVVTLEWSVTEYTQALGVDPVGVADPKGYRVWDTAVPLKGDPKDVGVRTEPSVDSIAGLEPDLILADTSSIPEKQMQQIEKIAPVAVFASAKTDNLIELVKDNQRKVGTLLGKEAEAQQLAKDYDAKVEEGKKKIADAGKTGTPVAYTYPYKNSNSLTLRMHGPGSGPGVVIESIGLKTAWNKAGDAEYGITESDVEGMTTLPKDTYLFYFTDEKADDPPTALKGNRIWQGLDCVKNNRVINTVDSVWIYGGTRSFEQMIDLMSDTIAK